MPVQNANLSLKKSFVEMLRQNREVDDFERKPMYAYIPDLDMVFEYDMMVSQQRHSDDGNYFSEESIWEFIGYGHCVYTVLNIDSNEEPEYVVKLSEDIGAFFKRKNRGF